MQLSWSISASIPLNLCLNCECDLCDRLPLWFDLRALVYLCNPTIWPSPSIHERDLTAIKRWLFAACVCLAERTVQPVSCVADSVLLWDRSHGHKHLRSDGASYLTWTQLSGKICRFVFYHWDFSVTFCWSRTTEDTHGLWLELHLHNSKYLPFLAFLF